MDIVNILRAHHLNYLLKGKIESTALNVQSKRNKSPYKIFSISKYFPQLLVENQNGNAKVLQSSWTVGN